MLIYSLLYCIVIGVLKITNVLTSISYIYNLKV